MGWLWGSDSEDAKPPPSSSYGSDSNFSSTYEPSGSNFSDSVSPGLESMDGLGQGGSGGDAELQSFLAKEQQKAQLQAMIHKMNDICWDSCVSTPESKLSSRTETCLSNCVERFIDSSLFITNRFAQLLSKTAGNM